MKKKFIAVLLAAAAGMCALAGCGAKESTTPEKQTEPNVTIRRELPKMRHDFDGILPAPPEHGITKPMPLPAPHRKNGFHLK
ncbi:MAG: hypothetical protein K2L67_01465 [Clostridia bacterium]|nr:hypothetical protein [Clostridia bacterium]